MDNEENILEESVFSVRDIMRRGVRTIHRDTFISEVAGIFDIERLGAAPLTDDGNIVGIISKTDLNHLDSIGADPHVTRAWEIATRQVITIAMSASLQKAAQKMLNQDTGRLIVVVETTPVPILYASDFIIFLQ